MIRHKLCALVAIPVALHVDEDEGKTWRLESERVSRSRAKPPRDAIRRFAEAITARDITGVLHVLTQRRRDGLTGQVEGFVAGIGQRINDRIDRFGTDRAELRWDENAIRYRIVRRKEEDEWPGRRHLHPAGAPGRRRRAGRGERPRGLPERRSVASHLR